jgi:hypothetical protein
MWLTDSNLSDVLTDDREGTPMAKTPFIGSDERPDLTLDLDARVGELTVRQLSEILGSAASPAKLKELPQAAKDIKEPIKESTKDPKDHKDAKDHKDPKEHKDQKDNKDQKDPKDQKDQKDQKDPKDHKDQKDQKDQKDPKEPKDHKDNKDHKEPKDTKDHKDIKDRKEGLAEKLPPDKHPVDKLPESSQNVEGASSSGLEDLIQRVTQLEQEVRGQTAEGNPASERRGPARPRDSR